MNDDLISRQAAIDSIEKQLRFGDELYPLSDTDKVLNYAFEVAASCVYNLPSASPRWIPVNERLPDEDYVTGADVQHSAEVLMTVYSAEDEETIIDYGRTVNGSWYSDITDCLVPVWWEVTAWMPLPQPWKGAGDE